jgi:ketosteroid isomerase-like protein
MMETPVNPDFEAELIDVVRQWDLVMLANDAEAIGRYMAEDWIIIGADGTESDKPTFLALVKSGALTHDVMESEDLRIRIYGDTAVLSARGVSAGTYLGQRFREVELASCVFVRQQGEWRCVLTHLSPLPDPVAP